MRSLSLQLPAPLYRRIEHFAAREDMTVKKFIETAAAEKTAAMVMVDYLEDQSAQTRVAIVEQVLERIKDDASTGKTVPRKLSRVR